MKKKRIAFLVDSFPNLSETFIYYQIISVINNGYDISIFPSQKGHNRVIHKVVKEYNLIQYAHFKRFNRPSKIKYLTLLLSIQFWRFFFVNIKICLQQSFRKTLSEFWEIEPIIFQQSFDLIHCHYLPNCTRASIYKKYSNFKGPIICSLHGYDVHDKVFLKTFDYHNIFDNLDIVTSNSDFTTQEAIALGCNASIIVYIPETLNCSVFDLPNSSAEEIFSIISIGRLVEFKGMEYGIRAIKDLIDRGITNIRYRIYGDGELKDELETIIDANNLRSFVFLMGSATQEELSVALSNSNVFLSPGIKCQRGRQENQGVVIQEAQAAGVPVIVSRVGGVTQGLIDSETGFLVESKNTKQMADKIEFLIKNPNEGKRMGEKGRKFVYETFDFRIIGQRYDYLYRDLITKKTKPN